MNGLTVGWFCHALSLFCDGSSHAASQAVPELNLAISGCVVALLAGGLMMLVDRGTR